MLTSSSHLVVTFKSSFSYYILHIPQYPAITVLSRKKSKKISFTRKKIEKFSFLFLKNNTLFVLLAIYTPPPKKTCPFLRKKPSLKPDLESLNNIKRAGTILLFPKIPKKISLFRASLYDNSQNFFRRSSHRTRRYVQGWRDAFFKRPALSLSKGPAL